MKINARAEMRLGEYAMRLLQIEAHMRRGEHRAARARLEGMADELEAFGRENEFPIAMVLIGGQLGLMSGSGHMLRGRLPGALLGAAAGWLVGHSLSCKHRRYLDEILERLEIVEKQLESAKPGAQSDAASRPASPSPGAS
jgi:hypothetical protein